MSIDHDTVVDPLHDATVADDVDRADATAEQPSADEVRTGAADRTRSAWTPSADWRIGVGTAPTLAAGWGLLAGWWTSRGPLTSSQAPLSIAISPAER